MIFTSSPYELCHQLSKGAEVTIMMVHQMQIHAPSGAWKYFQKRTDLERSAGDPANVVFNATYPQLNPATIAPICSTTRGGDQNVSRPIVRCQEISQMSPITIDADATSTA